MAKDNGNTPMVTIPASVLESIQADLAALKHKLAIAEEKADPIHAKQVYDAAWAAREAEVSRPAKVRTQDLCDKTYGLKGPRWSVSLDSTREDGKPGPNVDEHPTLIISANSPEEAEGRWAKLCGIRSHQYKLRTERVADAPEPVAA